MALRLVLRNCGGGYLIRFFDDFFHWQRLLFLFNLVDRGKLLHRTIFRNLVRKVLSFDLI